MKTSNEAQKTETKKTGRKAPKNAAANTTAPPPVETTETLVPETLVPETTAAAPAETETPAPVEKNHVETETAIEAPTPATSEPFAALPVADVALLSLGSEELLERANAGDEAAAGEIARRARNRAMKAARKAGTNTVVAKSAARAEFIKTGLAAGLLSQGEALALLG